jgi:hypothetical protein
LNYNSAKFKILFFKPWRLIAKKKQGSFLQNVRRPRHEASAAATEQLDYSAVKFEILAFMLWRPNFQKLPYSFLQTACRRKQKRRRPKNWTTTLLNSKSSHLSLEGLLQRKNRAVFCERSTAAGKRDNIQIPSGKLMFLPQHRGLYAQYKSMI